MKEQKKVFSSGAPVASAKYCYSLEAAFNKNITVKPSSKEMVYSDQYLEKCLSDIQFLINNKSRK